MRKVLVMRLMVYKKIKKKKFINVEISYPNQPQTV